MTLLRYLRTIRDAFWRALNHDALGVAKGAAYSSIISLFPALLLVASVLAAMHKTATVVKEIIIVIGRIMPPGTANIVQAYFLSARQRPGRVLISTSLITLWTGSGVMASWMEGFRNAYQIPRVWGFLKERMIAFGLVIMAGIPLTFATALVAFGNQIEFWMIRHTDHALGFYILFLWALLRWLIAVATCIAVMALIYHHAVPRTQPWHTVLPGSILATAAWFPATMVFGWYVGRLTAYSQVYGSLATTIVLLVWLYILSVIVLVGAEYNAALFPRLVEKRKRSPKTRISATRANVG